MMACSVEFYRMTDINIVSLRQLIRLKFVILSQPTFYTVSNTGFVYINVRYNLSSLFYLNVM